MHLLMKINTMKQYEYYDKVLQVAPNDTETLFKKGDALYAFNDYDEAIQYYDKVLEIDPNVH